MHEMAPTARPESSSTTDQGENENNVIQDMTKPHKKDCQCTLRLREVSAGLRSTLSCQNKNVQDPIKTVFYFLKHVHILFKNTL